MARQTQIDLVPGTVQSVHSDKGFGFIKDEQGRQWFFHKSAVTGGSFHELNVGARVQFEPGQGEKGPRANVVQI